ncbi:unnamed protein product [Calypogeia fissa]
MSSCGNQSDRLADCESSRFPNFAYKILLCQILVIRLGIFAGGGCKVVEKAGRCKGGGRLLAGVRLGTCCIVTIAVDSVRCYPSLLYLYSCLCPSKCENPE